MTDRPRIDSTTRRVRWGIGPKLYLALGAIVSLGVLSGAMTIFAFEQTRAALETLNGRSVPVVTDALSLSADGARLAATIPTLAAASDEEARRGIGREIADRLEAIEARTASLAARDVDAAALEREIGAFRSAAEALDGRVASRIGITRERDALGAEAADAHQRLVDILVPAIDDANFNLVIAAEETTSTAKEKLDSLIANELAVTIAGLELRAAGQEMMALVARAANVADEATLGPLQEKFASAATFVLDRLDQLPEGDQSADLEAAAILLVDAGMGDHNVFELRRKELSIDSLPAHEQVAVRADRGAVQSDLNAVIQAFETAITPVVDDASFELIVGAEDVGTQTAERIGTLVDEDVARMRGYLELLSSANQIASLARLATMATEVELLQPIGERIVAAHAKITAVSGLVDGIEAAADLREALAAQWRAADPAGGVIALQRRVIEEAAAAAESTAAARLAAATLDAVVDDIVGRALREAEATGSQTEATISSFEWMVIALIVAAPVLALLIGWLVVARMIVGRVTAITGTMTALTEGRLDAEVPGVEKTDEIGVMARALRVFQDNARRVRRLEEERRQAEESAQREKREAMHTLANGFEADVMGIVDRLNEAARSMEGTAGSMSSNVVTVTRRASEAATAAERTASNVQAVAAAAEELSVSIGAIGDQVGQATDTSVKAVNEAQETDQTVRTLAEAASRIGEVVNLISEIAGQTNLLALNATIEAARAGEMGRGFAVVASEVKSLATQTAGATDEIRGQIEEMQAVTRKVVEAISGIGGSIDGVHAITSSIAAAIEQQTTAVHDISRNTQEAAVGTSGVSESITDVSNVSQETGRASQEVLDAARDLSTQADSLAVAIRRFLDGVRAA